MINVPELNDREIMFSNLKVNPDMLQKAKDNGFDKSSNPYNKMFNKQFFSGLSLSYKVDIELEYRNRILRYYRALASSFSPRHEDKEAVCAMLLSEVSTVVEV